MRGTILSQVPVFTLDLTATRNTLLACFLNNVGFAVKGSEIRDEL